MMSGITFNEKIHTYRDWGLKLLSFYMPAPAIKENYIDIPGMNGSLDLTEVYGTPQFSDRDGVEIVFDLLDGGYSKWLNICEKISNVLHGKKMRMTLDDELNRVYTVRLNVDYQKSDAVMSRVVLSGKAEPFKRDSQSTSELWLWDSFNFENGIIQQFNNITVDDTCDIKLIGKGRGTIPDIVVNEGENVEVEYNGKVYSLTVGKNRISDLKIGDGDILNLTFKGIANITIDYRGEYL